MKKAKGQTVDLLYVNKNETKRKTKNVGASSTRPKKKKNNAKKNQNSNNEIINLDNEIIIGLTPKKEEQKKEKKSKGKNTKEKSSNRSPKRNKNTNQKKQKSRSKTAKTNIKTNIIKKKRKNKIIKWMLLIMLLVISIILFMMSSIFNISKITVSNNDKISSEEIINLSGLTIGTNMFRTTNKSIRNGIKSNPYIENVNIKRSITGEVTLDIEERKPTYMLKFANAYVYINNQGYMLEITEKPLELPLITGFKTPVESIDEGNRLIVEDLMKLEDVIKIMESAKSNSIADIITEVDISDSTNYILKIASESKTVQFGDATNINIKLLKIEAVIEKEKGVAGEIYFQDSDKTVFREEVKR